MANLEWTTEPPKQAGFYWVRYTDDKDQKPYLAMIIQYPDEFQMMFVGDVRAYRASAATADKTLWAGPIEAPPTPQE